MDTFAEIRAFLATVRSTARARLLVAAAAWCVAGWILLGAVVGIGAGIVPGTGWRIGGAVAAVLVLIGAAAGFTWAHRRWADDHWVARFVGRRAPPVASDLLSSVELERELSDVPRGSRELVLALAEQTTAALRKVSPAKIVPRTWVRIAGRGVVAAMAVHVLAFVVWGDTWRAGWSIMLGATQLPLRPFGASMAEEPLVGDLGIRIEYPGYMGRPALELPSSSGALLAPLGARLSVSTVALDDVQRARLVFDGLPPSTAVALRVAEGRLSGGFVVERPVSFRFFVESAGGEPRLEGTPRPLEIEPDRVPATQLFAPAQELEVSAMRRVELAYTALDDYGLTDVALVWRGVDGKEGRRSLRGAGVEGPKLERSAEGRFLWDLSELAIQPGTRVSYWIESRDNAEIPAPQIGRSEVFHLRVFSPRERHEEALARVHALFEDAVGLLGDRLVLAAMGQGDRAELQTRSAAWSEELERISAIAKEDPLMPKKLPELLVEFARKAQELTKRERLSKGDSAQRRVDADLVAFFEDAVVTLDDWIERQRLETVLVITDEIRSHRERLADALARYGKEKSPETKAEIEREIRAIKQRMVDLAEQLAQLRPETEERFVHKEALNQQESQDCMTKVQEFVAAGETEKAQAELARCLDLLDEQAKALEDSLKGLREEKFPEEQKALSELMDEVAELETLQRDVAAEADELAERYAQKAQESAKNEGSAALDKAKATLDELRRELTAIPKTGLTPFGQEELEGIKRRLDDVEKMLADGDVAEALEMARAALEGIRVLKADVEDDLQGDTLWSPRVEEALDHTGRAIPLAERLVDELQHAMPSADQLMTPEDQKRMERLRKRQGQARQRLDKLKQKVEKRGPGLPERAGGEAQKGLGQAGERMQRSERHFDERDPLGGRNEAREAADALGELRKGMQRGARPSTQDGGGGPKDDVVKIPGRDQSRAPEAFREDLLDAMKKDKPPAEYKEQVKRYYEELVK